MVDKISKHFADIWMEVKHPYNLCCCLFGQVESQRCELESFQITKKMLPLIITNYSGTFYIYNRETAEEIKISHRNKKSTFNVFCLYYNKEFHILIPFNGALIGKYKERFNCGNEI